MVMEMASRASLDEEIVIAWLEPVGLPDMLTALRDAGFSGNVYRGCFADLNAQLEDDEAGALHFLRHGYAESRIFQSRLDLAGLSRLRRLPVRNRVYLQNLLVALVTAWTGVNIRSGADLTTHAAAIEKFRALGGVPLLIVGDATAGFYRRGLSSGDRWICPLAMAPLEGGIEALLRTPPPILLAPRLGAGQAPMPTIWKFGQADVQAGYLAHRLRQGIGPGDTDAFLAFAAPMIERYATFLAAVVPLHERPAHWIASLFPPVWLAAEVELPAPDLVVEFGPGVQDMISVAGSDKLLDRTGLYRGFNMLLEKAVVKLGFNVLQHFDCFLATHGVIDEFYMVPMRDAHDLNYATTHGVVCASLWNIIDGSRVTVPLVGIREQFEQLLDEIRMVQTG